MLSRRHIRIKVLQALYEYFQDEENRGIAGGERKLVQSIDDIFKLYLYELKTLVDILRTAEDQVEHKRNKRLPSPEDINPNLRFVNNRFLQWLNNNHIFMREVDKNKISWGDDREVIRKIFREFQASKEYGDYMSATEDSVQADKKIIKVLCGKFLVHNDTVHQLYEDRNMHWADDLDAAQMMVAKTLKGFDEEKDEVSELPHLLKDDSDIEFARILYRTTIKNSEAYGEMIHAKANNWEMDRIAVVDVILMKMALAELVSFNEIPVKVTLNEYIELSKEYSTPKSGNFINGILDKLKDELTEAGDIRKIGRGLL
ncbi:MAG TPA: transcription antitermination factor NusB [Cryomorphaceae bacterium]|nr:transcription antitermination factor NusB [Cryomorphaceae bacterium]